MGKRKVTQSIFQLLLVVGMSQPCLASSEISAGDNFMVLEIYSPPTEEELATMIEQFEEVHQQILKLQEKVRGDAKLADLLPDVNHIQQTYYAALHALEELKLQLANADKQGLVDNFSFAQPSFIALKKGCARLYASAQRYATVNAERGMVARTSRKKAQAMMQNIAKAAKTGHILIMQ